MRLEKRMKEIVEGGSFGKRALWLLSLLYRSGVALRHRAYQYHLLPIKKVPAVVVSIGNIVAGGTGKTPLVRFLAEELSKNHKVAILSRGYRSFAEKGNQPVLVEPAMTAAMVGDEPLWLAQKLPQAQVWVGRDRVSSAKKAIESGAEIILMDDGLQHRRLHRDFEIIVVSGEFPYSNGYFLPRGYLRDLPSRLESATAIAVMGSSKLQTSVPQVWFERSPFSNMKGQKVALFCAIANPERFLMQVQASGAQITLSCIKPDHDPFSIEELEELAQKSKAEMLVCTEKDFVKLSSTKISIPIVPLSLELAITAGQQEWSQLIHQIKSQVQNERISSHAS